MPTTRNPIWRARQPGLTPEAIAAWQACDVNALQAALGLPPWAPSPLPTAITALGVDEHDPHANKKALRLQRLLLTAAGWPDCRQAYEANLKEAEVMRDYCAELAAHPEQGARGETAEARQRDLERAEAKVAYCKQLLNELGQP